MPDQTPTPRPVPLPVPSWTQWASATAAEAFSGLIDAAINIAWVAIGVALVVAVFNVTRHTGPVNGLVNGLVPVAALTAGAALLVAEVGGAAVWLLGWRRVTHPTVTLRRRKRRS